MKKLLITGATGTLGRQCVRLLKNTYEIHVITKKNAPENSDTGIRWHRVNLLDILNTNKLIKEIKADKLLHLAWETEHGKYVESLNNIDWVKASFLMAKSFYENGGSRAVFAGTCFEYDLSYGYMNEETTPLAPNSVYGLSKCYTNALLKNFTDDNNLSMAWGRIFYLYGDGENKDRLVPYIINRLLNRETATCSSGEQVRDYLYSADVAKGLSLLLDSDFHGNINICSNEIIRIKDIANEIAFQIGRSDLLRFDPSRDRSLEPKIIMGNNDKLMKLGWKPDFNLESGISEAINLMKK